MSDLNLHVFRWINGWSDSWAPFLVFFSDAFNKTWFKICILLLLIGMCVAGKRSRATAIMALIALGLANPSTDLWKHLLPEPRPFDDIANVITRLGTTHSHGTASAHAANMASVATVFAFREKWWGAPWVVAAVIVGFSRVYTGMHYPYQVLLGWTMGILCGSLVLWSYSQIEKRRSLTTSTSESVKSPNQEASAS